MRHAIGLLLASGSILMVPARGAGQSPHDAGGVGAMGLIGRGVTPEERPFVAGPIRYSYAPVSVAPEVAVPAAPAVAVPVVRPVITTRRPAPVAAPTTSGGGRDVARRPALARGNPYIGFDRSWLHGYWEVPVGPTPARRASVAGAPGVAPGVGSGWGLPAWLVGPMIYRWGYLRYQNPFIEGRGRAAGDPSRPVDMLVPPPAEAVLHDALAGFQEARAAFRLEDYTRALELADRSLEQMPNDPEIHEFRALTLLALHRYREAAAAFHAAIAVVPGWDWRTLLNLYDNPETYTRQLRMLETYSQENPRSAAGHFLLAVQYLTTGYAEAAAGQLWEAAALTHEDSLIARLARALQGEAARAAPPARADAGAPGDLAGTWVARPREGAAITLNLQPRGHVSWSVNERGRVREIEGCCLYADGVLTLSEGPDRTMAGRVTWGDPRHFTFKVLEGRPDDPGLSFEKSP